MDMVVGMVAMGPRMVMVVTEALDNSLTTEVRGGEQTLFLPSHRGDMGSLVTLFVDCVKELVTRCQHVPSYRILMFQELKDCCILATCAPSVAGRWMEKQDNMSVKRNILTGG